MATLRVFWRRDRVLVVRHVPVELRQLEQTLCQARGLPQAQAEHAFQGQTKLDGGIAEDRRPTSAPAGCSLPLELGVEPDHQRAAALERSVVRRPVRCAVPRSRWFTHRLRLPRSRAGGDLAEELCNNAFWRPSPWHRPKSPPTGGRRVFECAGPRRSAERRSALFPNVRLDQQVRDHPVG